MSKVITFSRVFPTYHQKAGEPTYFVEQIWNSLNLLKLPVPKNIELPSDFMWSILHLSNYGCKYHTIRSGNRFKAGEYFSPRVWSGKPYNSKQIIIAPDLKIEKQWSFDLINGKLIIGGLFHCLVSQEEKIESFAKNDGLNSADLLDWFKYPKPLTENQIICWNKDINY